MLWCLLFPSFSYFGQMKEKSTEELEDPQQEDTTIEQYQPVQVTKKAQQPPVYIQEIGPSLPEDGTSSMPAHILNLTKVCVAIVCTSAL